MFNIFQAYRRWRMRKYLKEDYNAWNELTGFFLPEFLRIKIEDKIRR